MLHGAIFLATCNAILLLRDVKLPNTSYLCKILHVNVYHISEMLVSLLLNLTKNTIGITESFFSNLFQSHLHRAPAYEHACST